MNFKISLIEQSKLYRKMLGINKAKDLKHALEQICIITLSRYSVFNNKAISASLLLTDDEEMTRLNFQYRSINKPTDVLSFPEYEFSYKDLMSGNYKTDNLQQIYKLKKIYLGDMAFSCNMIQKYADKEGIKFQDRFYQMFIHSFLHLLGFDHEKDSDYIVMQQAEDEIKASVILQQSHLFSL